MSAGMVRAAGCTLLALLVAACGTPTPQKNPQSRFNLSGYSATFKRGHADGCTSAGGTQRRDERQYRDDADYMMGWNDGRSACK